MFLDEAIVEFTSGTGGAGAASFHREKHVPRGGPNGADGGAGGDVILVADRHKRTLYDLKLTQSYKAQNGTDAAGNKSGKNGASIEVHVPVGTIVTDMETNEVLVDLSVEGMRYQICKGGRGGFGNLHYTSSVRQAPTIAQKGAPGETVVAKLELKLLADVGLIGLPNAGKSTLISRISAAKPKIADYPFTTIEPNLGVVSIDDFSFTVADMPGLIEGANEGKGLGHQFLKHVERTKILVHVLDCVPIDESDPLENFALIEKELQSYSEELYSRPRILAINKADASIPELIEDLLNRFGERYPDLQVFVISAVAGIGLDPLLRKLAEILKQQAEEDQTVYLAPPLIKRDDSTWEVVQAEDGFEVKGRRIERLIAMTNLQNPDSLRHLHRQLSRIGVLKELEAMGASEGDTVRIGKFEFEYEEEW